METKDKEGSYSRRDEHSRKHKPDMQYDSRFVPSPNRYGHGVKDKQSIPKRRALQCDNCYMLGHNTTACPNIIIDSKPMHIPIDNKKLSFSVDTVKDEKGTFPLLPEPISNMDCSNTAVDMDLESDTESQTVKIKQEIIEEPKAPIPNFDDESNPGSFMPNEDSGENGGMDAESAAMFEEDFRMVNELLKDSKVLEQEKEPEKSEQPFSYSINDKLHRNMAISSDLSDGVWSQPNIENSQSDVESEGLRESFCGLPSRVFKLLSEHKGVKNLYEWQEEFLEIEEDNQKKNFVITCPNNNGKTLLAEILTLRQVICRNNNVLFILSCESLVKKMINELTPFALSFGFIIEEYAAEKGGLPLRRRRYKQSVIMATIDKAFAIVESLSGEKRLSELGLIVIDQLHLLGDPTGQGVTLEMLLTYLNFLGGVHVVGMSEPIGNASEVAQFLNAQVYNGETRNTPFTEYVKSGVNILSVNESDGMMELDRTVPPPLPRSTDPDGISMLVSEIVPSDSVIVFSSTKNSCKKTVEILCKNLPKIFCEYRSADKLNLLRVLKCDSLGKVCHTLENSIPFGVAYYHSGLTTDELRVLEDAFNEKIISIMCCTYTLEPGVNLPARRVIIKTSDADINAIPLVLYKQMIGRAKSESFLISHSNDYPKVEKLLKSKIQDVVSKMDEDTCRSVILSAISQQVANTRPALRSFLDKTLFNVQSEKLGVVTAKIADLCITRLCKEGDVKVANGVMIEPSNNSSSEAIPEQRTLRLFNTSILSPSRLVKAAIKGSMNISMALSLYNDLCNKTESCLVMFSTLRILNIVTPHDVAASISPNYSIYFETFSQLDSKELQAANLIGVTDNIIKGFIAGQKSSVHDVVLKKFYITLILNEMWKQKNIWEVSSVFHVRRGFIETIMSSSAKLAANILQFCDALEELWCFKPILADLTMRLTHCCDREIIPFMNLPTMNKTRARQLLKSSLKTLRVIAQSDPKTVVSAVENLPINQARLIIASAKLQLLEKTANLRDEAENILEGYEN